MAPCCRSDPSRSPIRHLNNRCLIAVVFWLLSPVFRIHIPLSGRKLQNRRTEHKNTHALRIGHRSIEVRADRKCLDSLSRMISGSSAGYRHAMPFVGLPPVGRQPAMSRMRPLAVVEAEISVDRGSSPTSCMVPSARFMANACSALPSRNRPAISRARRVDCRTVVNSSGRGLGRQDPAQNFDRVASLDRLALLPVTKPLDQEPMLSLQLEQLQERPRRHLADLINDQDLIGDSLKRPSSRALKKVLTAKVRSMPASWRTPACNASAWRQAVAMPITSRPAGT